MRRAKGKKRADFEHCNKSGSNKEKRGRWGESVGRVSGSPSGTAKHDNTTRTRRGYCRRIYLPHGWSSMVKGGKGVDGARGGGGKASLRDLQKIGVRQDARREKSILG